MVVCRQIDQREWLAMKGLWDRRENPCNSSVIRKIFKRPHAIRWNIVDKETVDEIVFRTTNMRNRLMLELMAMGA